MRLSRISFDAFVTGFSGAAMPGPVLAACIALTVAVGFVAGPLVVLGHGLIELALVLAVGGGLGRALRDPRSRLVRGIALVGGLVLLLMAADMARGLPSLSLASAAGAEVRYGPVAAGLLLSAANPYFWIWWATIGLGLMGTAVSQRGRPGLAAFYAGHITSDLVWYSLVAFLISSGRGLLTDGVYRGLIGCCAVMLVYFGVRFARFGLRPPEPAADAA